MASQVLDELETLGSSLLGNVSADSAMTSAERETPAFAGDAECLPVSREDSLRCAKGFVVAVGIEVVAALFIFGLWRLWHILR